VLFGFKEPITVGWVRLLKEEDRVEEGRFGSIPEFAQSMQ
jgi:hypothetical protein